MYTKLNEHKIFCPKPQGGFYLFPHFDYYKERLLARGLIDSSKLCDRLLEETGVALLPSFDFGRPSEELTARLSYVDFDGSKGRRAFFPARLYIVDFHSNIPYILGIIVGI